LTRDIADEFPDFRVLKKTDSRLMAVIDRVLRIITLGKMSTYMTEFVTTVGTTVYVPADWYRMPETSRMSVLRHERVHMRQARQYGRLWFSLLYLFIPLPIGLAYFRMKFEREAYEESIRASVEYFGIEQIENSHTRQHTIRHFTSAEYFWMFPFRRYLERWYQSRVDLEKNKA
jgi:hypothetical protein